MEKASLQQLKQKYAGQWLAFLVAEEMPNGDLLGRMIAHNLDRRELHQELREKSIKRSYVTFAGPVIKPGYTVILCYTCLLFVAWQVTGIPIVIY